MREMAQWITDQGWSIVWVVQTIIWSYFILSLFCFFYVVKKRRTPRLILSILITPIMLVYPFLALVKLIRTRATPNKKTPETPPKESPWSFSFQLTNENSITVPNPFRGIFITGGAGAGKCVF